MGSTAPALRAVVQTTPLGGRVIDCGVKTPGGLQAGLALARVCLAGQAEVSLAPGEVAGVGCPIVQVSTDNPVIACMASQYAGWELKTGDAFVGMGSGPMRAIYGKEELFDKIPGREKAPVAVGCVETGRMLDDTVFEYVGGALGMPANKITLLAAPPTSIAGALQVVARSIETALHKLHQL